MSDEIRTDEEVDVEAHGFPVDGNTVEGNTVEGNTVEATDEEPDVEAHGFSVEGNTVEGQHRGGEHGRVARLTGEVFERPGQPRAFLVLRAQRRGQVVQEP